MRVAPPAPPRTSVVAMTDAMTGPMRANRVTGPIGSTAPTFLSGASP